ncbi:MAG TPA: type II toxin-antitoxin system RelE/ParE family toxin, partial [Phycisphaerae bacterium]|nr:type II toxin-antitoxin system RelE/ParE family toxin [Phycisphaerae bacterium]
MPEAHQVVITDEALLDLEAIAEFIRVSSPANAARVCNTLVDAIDSLRYMPTRCRRVGASRKRRTSVRALSVRPFIVYFRLDSVAHTVYVLAVRHGRRQQLESPS